MTITRADVADLRAGDVVEVVIAGRWVDGTTLRGPIWGHRTGALLVGDLLVKHGDGRPNTWENITLTVVSRAKPPLYVNSDKTEPDPGDVVRDADDVSDTRSWTFTNWFRGDTTAWCRSAPGCGSEWDKRDDLPARLRLLVDGRTGQVVQ